MASGPDAPIVAGATFEKWRVSRTAEPGRDDKKGRDREFHGGTEKREEAERIAQNSLPCEMEIGLNPQRFVCDLTLDSSNHPS
jgi:hypothetical protein